jgi:hypothetical protein
MAIAEINKAIEENSSSGIVDTTKPWVLSIRFDPSIVKEALLIRRIQYLMKMSDLSGGRVGLELLEEALNGVEFPPEVK